MMEIDRMSYIFGSFARRRQSQEVGSSMKRRSIEPAKATKAGVLTISHDRSKSTPHATPKKSPAGQSAASSPTAPPSRARSACSVAAFDESKLKCAFCKKNFEEPRVLPCLHTFCLRCLQELEVCEGTASGSWRDDESDGSANTCESPKDSGSGSGSAGSGYVSDKNNTSCSTDSAGERANRKRLSCPTCLERAEIPPDGVSGYPPNYILQHRMVLATLNAHNTHLLCDLCTGEISATFRCMECAVSFCDQCVQVHLRQKASFGHEVLTLEEARKRGITRVRRQIMCTGHPESELCIFCYTCYQVVCRECVCDPAHKGHTVEPVARAVKAHLSNLRIAAERARHVAEQSALAANRLNAASKSIEGHCGKLQLEVEKFIEDYVKAVELHKANLLGQISRNRSERMEEIGKYKVSLHKRVREARDVAFFLNELLSEGSDVEIMSFLKPVVAKIEVCNGWDNKERLTSSFSESIQFLPEETVQYSQDCCPLYGVITSQTVSPAHCVLQTEGLSNLRVGRRTEVTLEARSKNNVKLERGGEQVSAEVRFRDAGVSKFLAVNVDDRRDGTYGICFVPDVSGKLVLSVSVKGQPVKESPFPIVVRTLKPHHGTFHCCSFCSSGGSKEASCGCEGRMPGGYRGCGHGHDGHPGRRHWSCCGNVLEHSECTRSNASSHYQFTL